MHQNWENMYFLIQRLFLHIITTLLYIHTFFFGNVAQVFSNPIDKKMSVICAEPVDDLDGDFSFASEQMGLPEKFSMPGDGQLL